MRDLEYSICYQEITKYLPSSLETTSCSDLDSLRFMIGLKNGKGYKEQTEECAHYYSSNTGSLRRQKLMIKESTSLNVIINPDKLSKTMDHKITSSNSTPEFDKYIGSNYLVDVRSTQHIHRKNQVFNNTNQIKCEVYRCEFSTNKVNYCPACTSEAMFEVLKSLYECYKRRVCDNCNCILCGQFFREKRRSMRLKKSRTLVKIDSRIKTVEERVKQTEDAMVGKTPAEKEKLLKNLAMTGAPLPEGKTASEKSLINKVRRRLGIPPEPKTESEKEKIKKVAELGLLQPLEGKDAFQKEKILQNFTDMNIPLPEGRTDSERAIIKKVQAAASAPQDSLSEKLRKAKDAGFLTPLVNKSPQQKKNILKGLALAGLPLPEAKSPSEQKLMKKVRSELGLPPEPKTVPMKEKYAKAAEVGLMQPLEGKSPQEKERILTRLADMGIPLPTGRSASEKALIAKIKGEPRPYSMLAPSQKMRKAKAAGLITSLDSKTPEQREKILNGLANLGIPLPEGKTTSEKNLINKVRNNLGLPPEPKTPAMKDKHKKAADAGLLRPLEGKTPREKERILRGLQDMGIPLPQGRTSSEKALIAKIKSEPRTTSMLPPSEKMRRAKAAGLITPLKGKTPEEKEKILKGLATLGIPLPEGTPSEKPLINKVRAELGLPPEPKNQAMRDKHTKAANAGLLKPLEGKTPKEKEKILRGLNDIGIPLPEGRTPSEKALINKITGAPPPLSLRAPSDKMRMAKNAGFMTPLDGKTTEQKQKILTGLASLGIPLPEGKTSSQKKLIDKVRTDLGLPPTPKTPAMKEKHIKAANAGLLQPLEGKTPSEKEKILRGLIDMGIPLPEGRTPSEKALISKIKSGSHTPSILPPSEKMRRAKVAGLITPLKDKTPEQREKILKGLTNLGIPLPEGTTDSEKNLINKVRAKLGLPPEPTTPSMRDKHTKAAEIGILQPLQGKTPQEKERILRGLNSMGIPLPEGRTPSEKALISKIKPGSHTPSILPPSEKMRRAKVAGLITPLKDKTPEQREKILKGLTNLGIPLPEGTTDSEKNLINKVRAKLGLPPEPTTPSMKEKHIKAANAGLLQPLEGKTPSEKEKILRGLIDMGIPLPEGRTPSEKALISKIKSGSHTPSILSPSEKMRRAKVAGLITPLKDKTPEQREKILKGLANLGIPLPEGTTDSEKNLINKVRAKLGLPPEPTTPTMKDKHTKAAEIGILQPLQGKTPQEKERILRGLNSMDIPLPEGRTPSEKALISKIKAGFHTPSILSPSEKMRRAKVAGLITPLKDKTPEQREKILKGLASLGIPLPQGTTDSEKNIINKVRANLGLPPEPNTPSIKDKHTKAADAGLLQPLQGKTPQEKEKILRGLNNMGIPLPEGRTPSEKALISKIKSEFHAPSILSPSEKIRRAKVAGLITPLQGKTPEQREKILKGLATLGIPLPQGTTDSEKNLINKVRANLGLPPEPTTQSMKDKHSKAADAGLLQPLQGKTPKEKEGILKGLNNMGIPLPEGRTPSEKALISKIKPKFQTPSILPPSEKMRRAKVAGLITPLKDKTPEQKENILKGLANLGIPLPEGTTDSENNLINKVRANLGLPPEPKTPSMKDKHTKAAEVGVLQPLEGKTPQEKENILRKLNNIGIPLPEGRTPSEKALISKIKSEFHTPSILSPSEKIRRAKVAGLITPLKDKTPEQRENILKGLANLGIPLPQGSTDSEKNIITKVRANLGLPPEPTTPSMKDKHTNAADAGKLQPLQGKTPQEKERILRGLNSMGIPLPEGRTPSEKALISKMKLESHSPSILSPSEKMRRAKVAGLITPLKSKTPEQRQKILKGLANLGIPLPEGTTDSEKNIIEKLRTDLGLPPEPKNQVMRDKHAKAADAGFLQPLEGKTPIEKERILRGLNNMGIPLPKGRTPSEKSLITRIKAEPRSPSTPSQKMRRAKAGTHLAPSKKTTVDRTPPDKGPEEKLGKGKASALLTPLENKTLEQKEKILRGRAAAGLPLPIGKTPSEKKLIEKIKAENISPSEERKKVKEAGTTFSGKELAKRVTPPKKSKSEKIKNAKAAGLLTPLAGKTDEEKERIIRGLVNIGLPLPEAKTPSENKLIERIRAEIGLPPEPKTPSMKEKYKKAQSDGLITPLEGKLPEEQKAILKKLHDAGIPLPEGRTLSEKSITRKLKTSLKTIVKTSVCDHACGCDKKKIKFKHSYVRITVISPDLSSICDCSDECIPGGLSVTKDGIKVTIGNITDVPATFSTEGSNSIPNLVTKVNNEKVQLFSDCKSLSVDSFKVNLDLMHKEAKLANKVNSIFKLDKSQIKNNLNYNQNTSSIHISDTNVSRKKSSHPYLFERYFERYLQYPKCFVPKNGILKTEVPCYSTENLSTQTSDGNLTTILIVKSDTSTNMSKNCQWRPTGSFYTDSILSYTDDTNSTLTRHSDMGCYYSDTTVEYSGSVTNDYTTDATESCSIPYIPQFTPIKRIGEECNKYKNMTLANFICYRMSQAKQKKLKTVRQKTKVFHSAIWIKKVNSETDIATILNEPIMM